jgi:hypothetical protein
MIRGRLLGVAQLVAALSVVAPVGVVAVSGVGLVGCNDENDPKTHVKKLDDPAQRANAVKRLGSFFEDAMTKANKKRDAPEIVALLDVIVEPMTKTYTSGNLDEKTRKELIKSLNDMRDPRAAPAMAKALNDYEPGKNDEDVKYAAQWTNGLATAGKLTDQSVIDALWSCFSKFQASKAKSINLVTDLHDAVLAVKHPSYGPKAVEKLGGVVLDTPESQMDQIMFWQKTAIQVIREIKFGPAAKSLVKVLLTPTKGDLRATANAAIMVIPKDAEPVLVGALNGSDAELAKLAGEVKDKLGTAILADSVSWLSRPAGRDALIGALNSATDDTNRTVIAQCLTRFPPDAKVKDAFFGVYKKLPPSAKLNTPDSPYARPVLVQVSSAFYDPSLTDWVLKEVTTSKGDEGSSMQAKGLEAALKLMDKAHVKHVSDMVNKYWTPQEKTLFTGAAELTNKCDRDAACYAATFDAPVGSSPVDKLKAIKAARMAATYGKDDTKTALIAKIDKVKDGQARLAIVEAVDFLAGAKGDAAAADALDKIVAADIAGGNKQLMQDDDALVKVANRLRARAQ